MQPWEMGMFLSSRPALPASHQLHLSPQVISDSKSVSPSKQWNCAAKSYGRNKAISILAPTDSRSYGRALNILCRAEIHRFVFNASGCKHGCLSENMTPKAQHTFEQLVHPGGLRMPPGPGKHVNGRSELGSGEPREEGHMAERQRETQKSTCGL